METERRHNIGLDTRIFLPNWWVAEYESVVRVGRSVTAKPLHTILNKGLFSGMGLAEINLLAELMPILQKQILSSPGLTLELNLNELLPQTSEDQQQRHSVYERTIVNLGGLRLQARGKEGGKIYSERIFTDEVWHIEEPGIAQLSLQMSQEGAELLLGYKDLYRSLYQTLLSERTSFSALDFYCQTPLSLWKSIWLDLHGSEQAILLQLEKEMQWSNRWLNLEGIFETSLEKLFRGLKVPGYRSGVSKLARMLKVMEKLGRKLVDHGFLAGSYAGGCMVFDQHTTQEPFNGFQVSWKIARERLLDDDSWLYRQQVSDFFTFRQLRDRSHNFACLLPGVALSKATAFVGEFVPGLESTFNSMKEEPIFSPVLLDGNGILSKVQLFLEWSLRQLPGNYLNIPSELLASEAAKVAHPGNSLPISERLRKFAVELLEHPSYLDALINMPFATVVNRLTASTAEFSTWMQEFAKKEKMVLSASSMELKDAKPQLVFSRPGKTDERANSPQESVKTGEKISKMRKIASDELLKLRSKFPQRYAQLKSMYINSLQQDEQQLILDVKRRMQAGMFEEHLKPHLVKFMIENPSSWSSAGTADNR